MITKKITTIPNVIFDLGGVVFEWNPKKILENYYDDESLRTAMMKALFHHPDWLEMDRGTLIEPVAIERLKKRIDRPYTELTDLFNTIRRSLIVKKDTVALIDSLSHQDIPLYCLSNMSISTFDYLQQQHSFFKVFKGIVISAEIKMVKPENQIFQYLLNRYGLSANQTIFIDDHQPNIYAAQELGIQTILFKDAIQCESELDILFENM